VPGYSKQNTIGWKWSETTQNLSGRAGVAHGKFTWHKSKSVYFFPFFFIHEKFNFFKRPFS